MGVKGLTHYLCQSTIASQDVALESFAAEYKKANKKPPLLVFDGESFWHVLHGSNLPKLFGGQFIQFRKKAEDFCKRLTQLGFNLAFIFGNSPISAETKAEERGKQTLLHLTSFYRQLNEKCHGLPQINEIWPPCLRNVFPYYLRSLPNITVLQSLMDKDLSIACYAKENDAAAIVSNDSDMLIYAVCPVMVARGLTNARNRVVMMYPEKFCKDIGLTIERLPLLSVYLGNTETPITTSVVEASDGVIQRKIKAGDRGNVQDAIEYVRSLEEPICLEELAADIFQQVDEENIQDVRISLGRYVIREREYPYDVSPMYKIVPGSPMIEPIQKYDVDKSENLEAFLEKIKKPVIECDIILKAKAWRRDFNIMHMSWPVPGAGIPSSIDLYGPIFSAHATLLGKKEHNMIIPRFERDPIRLAEPAFRNIKLKPAKLSLPDGTKLPDAHELWISQDKRLQVMALITIWEATDLDFETLMKMVPATLTFLLVLHWIRRKCNMQDWEIYAFLATHVRMRHFTCDQIWRMDDIMVAKGITPRSIVLANVFSKLMGRFLWMVSLCGSPFKTVDLLPDLMFDGMIFQKKYEQARVSSEHDKGFQITRILDAVCNQAILDSRRDRERVMQLFGVLCGHRVTEIYEQGSNNDRCNPMFVVQMNQEYEPNWYEAWTGNATKKLEAYEREKAEKEIKNKKAGKHFDRHPKDGYSIGHSISPPNGHYFPSNDLHEGLLPEGIAAGNLNGFANNCPPGLPQVLPNGSSNGQQAPPMHLPEYEMPEENDPFSGTMHGRQNGLVPQQMADGLNKEHSILRQYLPPPPNPRYPSKVNHYHELSASQSAHAHHHALPPNTPKIYHPVGPGCGAPESFVVTPELVDPAPWDMPPHMFENQHHAGMPGYGVMVQDNDPRDFHDAYPIRKTSLHARNREQLARHNCMLPASSKRPNYENFALNRFQRDQDCASFHGSNITDDHGYATMTNLSRSSVRGSNLSDRSSLRGSDRSFSNNNYDRRPIAENLSFSAAISSKCNDSSYSASPASDPEEDEASDEEENEEDKPMSKLSQLAARRSRRDSGEWEEMKNLDDNWAEIDEIPSDARELNRKTKEEARLKVKLQAKQWEMQKQIDIEEWSDGVSGDYDPFKSDDHSEARPSGVLGFLQARKDSASVPYGGGDDDSNPLWNSPTPEPEVERDARQNYETRRPAKETPRSDRFSYAQAAGASKEDRQKSNLGDRAASFTLRNDAREFIPRCQSASSQADTTDSEFDGYQTPSDVREMSYRGQAYRGAYAAAYGAYGLNHYQRVGGYGYPRYANRQSSKVPIYYHDPEQGWVYGYGERPVPRSKHSRQNSQDSNPDINSNDVEPQQMGDGLPPVSSAASTRRAMLENMGMPSVPPGYAPYAMMPPVSRAGPRLVQDPRLARFVLVPNSSYMPNYKLHTSGPN